MIPISELNELEDEVINLYKELHRIPELGLNEVKTAALIANKLKEWNIETITGVARTGVIGTVYGVHAGKTIALRADMLFLLQRVQGSPTPPNIQVKCTHADMMHMSPCF